MGVDVDLRRDHRETVPCLVLRVGDAATEAVELTLEEASQLSESLLAELRSARMVEVDR